MSSHIYPRRHQVYDWCLEGGSSAGTIDLGLRGGATVHEIIVQVDPLSTPGHQACVQIDETIYPLEPGQLLHTQGVMIHFFVRPSLGNAASVQECLTEGVLEVRVPQNHQW